MSRRLKQIPEKVSLLVAEKPSVARAVAQFLAQRAGRELSRTAGVSQYNPVFEFQYPFQSTTQLFRVTSVSGHVMGTEFPASVKDWNPDTIDELFKIDVVKQPLQAARGVLQNLHACTKGVDSLILWLDCDREGEAIAFDVLEHCREKNENLEVHRAHFSALTMQDVTNAMENLTPPNKNMSDAVKVR
jgi:DNA topoisomerase-3